MALKSRISANGAEPHLCVSKDNRRFMIVSVRWTRPVDIIQTHFRLKGMKMTVSCLNRIVSRCNRYADTAILIDIMQTHFRMKGMTMKIPRSFCPFALGKNKTDTSSSMRKHTAGHQEEGGLLLGVARLA